MIAAGSRAEQQASEIWKTLWPDQAYVAGLDEAVGQFFVPTPARVRRMRLRIAKTRASTKDVIVRKFLGSLDAGLTLPEPARMPEFMVSSFFGYMMKEDVVPEHMAALAAAAIQPSQPSTPAWYAGRIARDSRIPMPQAAK